MKDEKLSIAKRKVSQAVKNLDASQTGKVEIYVRKLFRKKSTQEYGKREHKRFEEIRTWEMGTKVVCSSSRQPEFDGEVGFVIRHLGSGSKKTIVKFIKVIGNCPQWRIPSIWLSKATPENVKRIQDSARFNKGLGRILTKALNNMG